MSKSFNASPLAVTTTAHKQFYDDPTTIQNFIESLATSGTTVVVKRPGAADSAVKSQIRQLETFKIGHSLISLEGSESHNTVWSSILNKYGSFAVGDYS